MEVFNIGSEDVFLTGKPQITFFKLVYRRHTNFATEIKTQHFYSKLDFGSESTANIDKIGDLMTRVYLEIEIPDIILKKDNIDTKNLLNQTVKQKKSLEDLMLKINRYIENNVDIAKNILEITNTNNIYVENILTIVNDENLSSAMRESKKELYDYLKQTTINDIDTDTILNMINEADIIFNLKYLIKKYSGSMIRLKIKSFVNNDYYDILSVLSNYVTDKLFKVNDVYKNLINNTYSEYHKSAWVEELGHSIVDTISFLIGNQIIDTHTGEWLIIYNNLYGNIDQTNIYNELIGNVPRLTNYDAIPKKAQKLLIPLRFFFCRYIGLALPLISLKYHDVSFDIKLKDLNQVFYHDNSIKNSDDISSKYNIKLKNSNLLVEYIFLDSVERRRFASSSHEYLIEGLQFADFDDVVGDKVNFSLNFSNPIKFITWIAQPLSYRYNDTGTIKCQWNNFGMCCDKTMNPIEAAGIKINNYDRISPNIQGAYYNYVQPYWHFNRTPSDGINVYSFATMPMVIQPSSTLNASRIDDLKLLIKFYPKNPNINHGMYVGVYAIQYNILRIFNGIGGLAFIKADD